MSQNQLQDFAFPFGSRYDICKTTPGCTSDTERFCESLVLISCVSLLFVTQGGLRDFSFSTNKRLRTWRGLCTSWEMAEFYSVSGVQAAYRSRKRQENRFSPDPSEKKNKNKNTILQAL